MPKVGTARRAVRFPGCGPLGERAPPCGRQCDLSFRDALDASAAPVSFAHMNPAPLTRFGCPLFGLALWLTLATGICQPAPEGADKALEFTKAHYTKYDYRIAMRDGVRLFTSVYVPKESSQPCPMLMQRTPYSIGPYGVDNYRSTLGPSSCFTNANFIFVYQD